MKKLYVYAALYVPILLLISSCASNSHLVFVKAHPANAIVSVAKPLNDNLAPLPASTDAVITPSQPVLAIAPLPATNNNTPARRPSKAFTSFNKHIATTALALVHNTKKATAMASRKHVGVADNDNDGLRSGLLLIIIGLLMQLFWTLGGLWLLLTVIGSILVVIGIICLILWLL